MMGDQIKGQIQLCMKHMSFMLFDPVNLLFAAFCFSLYQISSFPDWQMCNVP